MLAACCLTASAGTFTVGGIKYNVTDSAARHVEVISNTNLYNVTIPATVKCDTTTYTVTAIGEKAFYNSTKIYSITLPETVVSIGASAFYEASNLYDIALPTSLKKINASAFSGCLNLAEINLPDSLEYIGSYAFYGTGLLSVKVPKKVVYIYDRTFYNCKSLQTVALPETLVSIGKQAFRECSSLKDLTIPSAQEICEYAFSDCTSLVDVVLPENLVELGAYAFDKCYDLTSVTFTSKYQNTLSSSTFRYCNKLKEVKLPENLVYMEYYVFDGCSSLEKIDFPKTLYSIGNYAFRNTGLKSLWIPRNVRDLGVNTFADTPIQSVYLPHYVSPSISGIGSSLGSFTFYNTAKHCDLYVPASKIYGYKTNSSWYSSSSTQNWRSIQELKFSAVLNDRKMIVGSTEQLEGTLSPDCLAADSLTWTSSNPAVATVDRYGNVTAIATGSTTISVTLKAYDMAATGSCTVTVNAAPDTNFAVADVSTFAGGTVNVPVEMNNTETITAFQCDVYLPKGLSLAVVEDEYDITFAGRESRTHSLASNIQPDGAIRIVAISSRNAAFTGNSGALFNLPVVIADSIADYQVEIKNICVVDNNNAELRLADMSFKISATNLIMGDANCDTKVSISDATTTVSYILGENPEPFSFAAADVNSDSAISIIDVTGIVDILLGNTASAPAAQIKKVGRRNVAAPEGDRLYIENFSISAGETKEVEVCLANSIPYTAFQCDVYLPEGLNFYEEGGEYFVDLSSRKSRSHSIGGNLQSETGALRVVSFSQKNANFSGNDGALFYLTITASEDMPEGPLEMSIKAISFVSDNGEYDFPECTAAINAATGASLTKADGMSIYAEGNLLHIDSPRTCTVPMTTVDGRTTVLQVAEGSNTFTVGAPGLYIVGRSKVAIKK